LPSKQESGRAKINFSGIIGPGLAHLAAGQILMMRGFFAFAKIF
jgi:hypothetical protein